MSSLNYCAKCHCLLDSEVYCDSLVPVLYDVQLNELATDLQKNTLNKTELSMFCT